MNTKKVFLIITAWILFCLFCGFVTDASAQQPNVTHDYPTTSAIDLSHVKDCWVITTSDPTRCLCVLEIVRAAGPLTISSKSGTGAPEITLNSSTASTGRVSRSRCENLLLITQTRDRFQAA